MATRLKRWLVAALVALLTLLIAHWFDAGVLADAQLRAGHPGLLFDLAPIAHMLTAAGVVVLALAAWWSRSLLVGVCYALVGGCLVFLPAMYWAFDSVTHGRSTPLAPQPIASWLGDWFLALSTGVTGAVFTLAAAMLLSGLVVIERLLSGKPLQDLVDLLFKPIEESIKYPKRWGFILILLGVVLLLGDGLSGGGKIHMNPGGLLVPVPTVLAALGSASP